MEANATDESITRSIGVCIYRVNTEDFHLPSDLIRESASPAFAAVVAAPIRKLCPEKLSGQKTSLLHSLSKMIGEVSMQKWGPVLEQEQGTGCGGSDSQMPYTNKKVSSVRWDTISLSL